MWTPPDTFGPAGLLVDAMPSLLAAEGPDLGRSFGRLHPLVVHFPIALGLVAVAVEWWRSLSRQQGLSVLTRPLLWFAAASAVLATVSGWVNASFEHDGSASETLDRHRWIGTGSAVALMVLAVWCESLQRGLERGAAGVAVSSAASLGSFRWVALLVAGAVGVAGHLGGELVHGSGYLTDYLLPRAEVAPKDATAAEPARLTPEEQFFVDEVRPLLEAHCIECHGAKKQKGGLRMDTKAWLFDGAEEEWTVRPGKAEESLLLKRTLLPREDPDAMPPEGDGLTDAEKAVLRTWIEKGAAYPESMPSGDGATSTAGAASAAAVGSAKEAATAGATMTAAGQAAMKALLARGVLVQPLAADSPLLDVNAMRAEPPFGDADATVLAELAPLVANLNLAKTAITDAGVAAIGPMPNLERLRLDGTAVGDAGVAALGTLPRLESINLVAAKVTPASIGWFRLQPALRRIYVWQTGLDDPDSIRQLTEGSARQAIGADLPLAEPTTPPMPAETAPAEAAPAATPPAATQG